MCPPRFELGTLCVLDIRDNQLHYGHSMNNECDSVVMIPTSRVSLMVKLRMLIGATVKKLHQVSGFFPELSRIFKNSIELLLEKQLVI